MLRVTIALFVALAAIEPALSADQVLPRRGWHQGRHRTVILPPGLPRPHYNFRTTITEPYVDPVYISEIPVAPVYVDVPYIPPWVNASPLPYGNPYVPYWDRLPYACGVYGYCW
jgi:hypothetical protein